MKRDDILWKGILENVFDDFLRFFFKDADALFDMKKGFQFLDKELEQLFPAEEVKAPKFIDKLVKVFTRNGEEGWVLVHIEVQGYKDAAFEKRMFTYFYRIFDKYEKPVTAIAILTDTHKNFRPKAYSYNYLGTSNIYKFNTYKILDQREDQLMLNENPFSIVVLTVLLALKQKTFDDNKLFELKLGLAKNLLYKKIPVAKIRSLFTFLEHYVHFANPENKGKFAEAIQIITENKKTMGIEELIIDRARKEEAEKIKIGVVKKLLKGTDFPAEKIADFAGVSEEFVKKIKGKFIKK